MGNGPGVKRGGGSSVKVGARRNGDGRGSDLDVAEAKERKRGGGRCGEEGEKGMERRRRRRRGWKRRR
jgi:hypothetical protein